MANEANIRAVITAKDEASGVLKGFASNVSSISTRVATSLVKAGTAFTTAASAATAFSVKSAADFEQTRIGLENMLGSADKARAILSQVSKFAAETPFEFPELANSVKQLVAFGFNGEDAVKTMKQLGDVSAAIGAPIGDLSYLMGTLKTQGRAFAIDIRQFAQRGIPIYEYLAKVLGKNEQAISEMITAGEIGFPQVQKAFEAMTAEGGKFHGTMIKQSKSLSGLFSTLKDNIGQTARELVGITQEGDIKEGSLFDKLRIGAAWLVQNLPSMIDTIKGKVNEILPTIVQWGRNIGEVASKVADYLSPKLEALWNTITTKIVPAVSKLVEAFGPTVGAGIVWAVGLVTDAFNILLTVAAPIASWLADNTPVVYGFAAAWIAVKAAMALQSAVTAFQTSMVAMQASYATMVATVSTPVAVVVAVAAAIIAIQQVIDKYKELQKTINESSTNINKDIDSIKAAQDRYKKSLDEGKISQETYNKLMSNSTDNIRDAEKALKDLDKQRGVWASFNAVADKVFGFLDRRATGGPVTGNQPYLVGEKGPELFVPNSSGSVMSADKTKNMGENTQVAQTSVINISVNAGAFMGTDVEARRFAQELMIHMRDIAGSKNMSLQELLG